jgi:alkylation response protein AidB-like acyl-CoA dehydrogenase
VPVEHGGAGVDFRFNAILGRALARAGLGLWGPFSVHVDIVAPYLVELATPGKKDEWLPRACRGEIVTAIAMTEPGTGSDLAALRTSARREGGDWLINGSKTFITNGFGADLVVVATRTGEPVRGRGLTLFAVEAGMPGFSRGRKLEKLGQHESDTAELFFEDVRVSSEHVLGEVDMGFFHMTDRLPQERLSAACGNIAHAAWAVEETLRYVTERHAFGRPIGTFQNSRFVLAELATMIEITQCYVNHCIAARAAGELTAVDAAKAKWWTSDVQNKVLDACVQLHGGYGYMEEYPIARAWVDGRITRVWAGTNEIMKEIVGRSLGLAGD